MQAKLLYLSDFLNTCWQQPEAKQSKRGKPQTYTSMSFLLFFMLMLLKGIHAFAAMHRWAKANYVLLGWQQAPDRKTIRRRFLALPALIQQLMPAIALQCQQRHHPTFGYACSFADKSVFRALGGLWHKKHMLLKVVPHASIDTEASWAKSEYHGWRFGYGLHLICNRYRFPLMATVTTASTKDYRLLETLVAPLQQRLVVVVADSGYFAGRFLKAIHERFSILVTTPCLFKVSPRMSYFKQYYNDMAGSWAGKLTYRRRKPSIEPTFALIKELTGLTGNTMLPYKGLDRVSAYLMIASCTVQLIMYDNFTNQRELGSLENFKVTFQ
ncbi:transposase [Runella sp. MFBS21]|uniref:transposase n=1 Tax=Runella sp. MFBS21 TaxID=3034018 RepID=UPI0023F9875C|nr:transposase [Runella sp. MFBS21]MDF7822364.1 transposase [Runella sp. MFBS21]